MFRCAFACISVLARSRFWLQASMAPNERPSKPYEFIGLGAMDVTKPYKFIWFGDTHGPKPYKFIGLR